ncbi:carboxypeptidase-like regulatory domain-containing protein [Rubinisphaera brasiliensis]|nr:carboxypeptidase-like regulatory domain-containing protein [Rubinisphaera brasiliensis]
MNRQSVSGTVSLAGDPVITGLIEFCPVGNEGVSSGASIADGEYSIPSAKGLPPGDYLIRISSAGEEAVASKEMPGEAKLQKELIPASYNVNSQEIRSVSAGEKNIFDFEIP